MPKYLVVEIQTFESGAVSVLPAFAYDNQNSAESKYHSLLATAAISKLAKHAVVMMSEEGFQIKRECYIHETETEEPETVTEG